MSKSVSNKIYFDYAATTPLDPEVEKVMLPYFKEKFGNPGSLHSFGQEAIKAIDEARETIAESIGADFREIIFTGSATEANNLALRGIAKGIRNKELGIMGRGGSKRTLIHNSKFIIPRIIVSAIEHESILETARDLEREGVEVVYLPVDREGFVNLEKLKESLNERTILVSIMYANNEIGTIQPIAEISKIIKNFRESRIKNQEFRDGKPIIHNSSFIIPLLHTDAVQAFQYLNCNVDDLGIDLMTLSAHKIYGPKGVGVLYVRNYESGITNQGNGKAIIHNSKFIIHPIVTGGGQEFGLRSGTENVPAIAGFAKAVRLSHNSRELENSRMRELGNYFWQGLKKVYPKAQLNGIMNQESGIKNKKTIIHNSLFIIPSILNVYFPGKKADDLLIKLDMAGIAVSSGSACSVRSPKPSHVLGALGLSSERVKSSLRFSFGRFTTKEEIDEALERLKDIL